MRRVPESRLPESRLPDTVRPRRKGRHLLLAMTPILVVAAVPVLIYMALADDDAPAMRLYSDVQSCQAEYSTADCATAMANAQAQHDLSAPHYGSQVDCEQIYGPGGCMSRGDGGGGFFIPLMTGFLIGQAVAGSQVYYQPVYVDRQGMAYAGRTAIGTYARDCIGQGCPRSSAGYVYASGSGGRGGIWSSGHYSVTHVSHGGGSSMAHSSSISRGGFGSTAHSIGGSSS